MIFEKTKWLYLSKIIILTGNWFAIAMHIAYLTFQVIESICFKSFFF